MYGQLAEVTELIRSTHPDRALPGTNPTRLAVALQPAVEQGLLTQRHAESPISIATKGIRQQAEDFRALEGEALDLSTGITEPPDYDELLLDFYYRINVEPVGCWAFQKQMQSTWTG